MKEENSDPASDILKAQKEIYKNTGKQQTKILITKERYKEMCEIYGNKFKDKFQYVEIDNNLVKLSFWIHG